MVFGPGDTTRLRWLLGGGPWVRESNVRFVHHIMKVAFHVLLAVASCLPNGQCELFIYDLSRVSSSWRGFYGWRVEYWENCMLEVLPQREGVYYWNENEMNDDGDEMYYWLRADLCGEGFCESLVSHGVGALRACGEQCQLCLYQTHSATEHECLCAFHTGG